MNTLTFDIETYSNYTLFALRDMDKNLITFEIRGKHNTLTDKQIKKLNKLLTKNIIVTFNGLKFDEPITAYAFDKHTALEIYLKVQEIIQDGVSVYNFYRATRTKKFITNHIDIMDVARGSASLKLYGARLGTKKLQDLPYSPETKLTNDEMDEVLSYCENDNVLTDELFKYLKDDLELRSEMGKQYNMNFMSFKGAKIAEMILVKECDYQGKYPDVPKFVRYKAPKYIKFKTPELKALYKQIKNHTYYLSDSGKVMMPDFLKKEVPFDGINYKFGIGGLHGSISSKTITPNDDELIVDIDYKSLYPSLIIQNDFSPKHIGSKFAKVYQTMYDKRNKELKPKMKTVEYMSDEYKTLDRQQNTMKLVLNSSFGQTGQRFSKIYDPNTMLNTTLTGQLTLMMVIEKLYLKGYSTFYANTDGITLLVKKKDLDAIQKITRKFDKKTGLEMEYNYFKSSHIRDVNNFINITTDNSVKSKGAFGEPNLEKNAQTPIVFEAVRQHLLSGIDIETTIRNCNSIHDFCSSRTVTGGAIFAHDISYESVCVKYSKVYQGMRNIKKLVGLDLPAELQIAISEHSRITKKMLDTKEKFEMAFILQNHGKYLGKVVRWYYSTDGSTIHYKKTGNKVPMSEGSMPMMNLTKKLPKDLNYEWYIDYAYRMLEDLGYEM